MYKLILPFVTICVLIGVLAGCESPEQNFEFREGKHLTIVGPTTLTLQPDTTTVNTADRLPAYGTYYTKNSTIKKTYKWSVSGNAKIDSTFRYKDLHVAITFPVTSADSTIYTINVDDGEYTGSLEVKVCRSTKLTDKGFCKEQ